MDYKKAVITTFLLKNNKRELSSSSEVSNSEDELKLENDLQILQAIVMVNETRGETKIEKLTGFVERVIPNYLRDTFKENFR